MHGAQEAQQTALKGHLWEARATARNCLNKQLFFISLCRGKAPTVGAGPCEGAAQAEEPPSHGRSGIPMPRMLPRR